MRRREDRSEGNSDEKKCLVPMAGPKLRTEGIENLRKFSWKRERNIGASGLREDRLDVVGGESTRGAVD